MKNISIVILAAGKGTRMKSNKAKVLHNLASKPMIYYIIKEAKRLSDDISVVISHQKDEVIKTINSFFEGINFIEQNLEKFPGTGGAIRDIKPKYNHVLILNGDMPLVTKESLESLIDENSDITMSIFNLKDPSGYGRVILKDNEVLYIVEQKDATKEELKTNTVNAGVYCFKKDFLEKYVPLLSNNNAQNEYYITDLIKIAKDNNKKVKGVIVDEKNFKGINSKRDLAKAEEILLNRIKNRWMDAGVIMNLPETIYIDNDVEFVGECIIEQGSRITGKSLIKNSHIKAYSIIEDSEIIDSDVGPLAHIRPNSYIENTHIGNFVEVKKSKLSGVKAGHLSYLGDSEIDIGTNIGAGTITCNYDGKNKYKTKIGKNVFVGSDTQLVAPINIEDDVIIAAGTTVTKNIKKGSLAISRTPLKFIENFFYKFFKKEK